MSRQQPDSRSAVPPHFPPRSSFLPPRPFSRRGLSLIEVVMAIGIMSLAAVSMYQIFSSGYRVVYRSRYASMAAQVARETLEELQQIALTPTGDHLFRAALYDPTGETSENSEPATLQAASLLRDWRESADVIGSAFLLTAGIMNLGEPPPEGLAALEELMSDELLQYPEEYGRIRRSIEFQNFRSDDEHDILRVRVYTKWEEWSAAERTVEEKSTASAVFETFIVREDRSLARERLAPGGS